MQPRHGICLLEIRVTPTCKVIKSFRGKEDLYKQCERIVASNLYLATDKTIELLKMLSMREIIRVRQIGLCPVGLCPVGLCPALKGLTPVMVTRKP